MNPLIPHLLAFLLPLFFANTLHMVVVKLKILEALARPISVELFGKGKTYRAFIVLPVFTATFSIVFQYPSGDILKASLIGALLGIVYLLAELPNSYFKRKIGIGSGETHPKYKVLQVILDKIDSLILLGITYYLITDIGTQLLLCLLLLSFLVHLVFSYLLFVLKIKKNI